MYTYPIRSIAPLKQTISLTLHYARNRWNGFGLSAFIGISLLLFSDLSKLLYFYCITQYFRAFFSYQKRSQIVFPEVNCAVIGLRRQTHHRGSLPDRSFELKISGVESRLIFSHDQYFTHSVSHKDFARFAHYVHFLSGIVKYLIPMLVQSGQSTDMYGRSIHAETWATDRLFSVWRVWLRPLTPPTDPVNVLHSYPLAFSSWRRRGFFEHKNNLAPPFLLVSIGTPPSGGSDPRRLMSLVPSLGVKWKPCSTCHDRLQLPLFFRDVFRLDHRDSDKGRLGNTGEDFGAIVGARSSCVLVAIN